MAESKIKSLWKVISKNSFVINDDELTCIICKKVLVDAVQSNVCGCHYCYQCISDYTKSGTHYCPGYKKFCKDEPIALEKNAFRNPMLNKRILTLKVNCPNQSCTCIIEFSEMSNHLDLCKFKTIKCPYVLAGCNSRKSDTDEVVTHLHSDTLLHTELLMDLIQNLKNEVKDLKAEFVACKVEIRLLKEAADEKDKKIVLLEESLEEKFSKLEVQINVETVNREKGMSEQVRNCQSVKDDMEKLVAVINENIEASVKCQGDIKNIKNVIDEEENRIETITEQMKQIRKEMEIFVNKETPVLKQSLDEQRQRIEDSVALVNDLMNDLNKVKEIKRSYDEERDRKIIYWIKYNKLCPKIDVDFVWRVAECSKKLDTDIYSEPFYLNNYKLCLYLFIGSSSGNIYLYCYVMKGHSDERFSWPLTRAVTLSIVDQNTLRAHACETYQCAFNRPMRDKGGRVGSSAFIQYASIKDKSSVLVRDSIVFSCVLSDQ